MTPTLLSWQNDAIHKERNATTPFKFILGVSTGHSGSTTAQNTMMRPNCPWDNAKSVFEGSIALYETKWKHSSYNQTCERVNNTLIPHLYNLAQSQVLVDIGHYHNRGSVLKCLADLLGDSAVFLRIRRNRYDVAMSFSSHFYTPCLTSNQSHPMVSLCPHSVERGVAGPVYLNVTDVVWDAFTPFQRFLWYADEVEERWHVMQSASRTSSPQFHQVTWSTTKELKDGLFAVRASLGCTNDEQLEINKDTNHVPHKAGERNCSDMIRQDLEYRRLMKYGADKQRYQRLFAAFGQHVDSSDCRDTHDELVAAIRQYSGEGEGDLDVWVLPEKTAR